MVDAVRHVVIVGGGTAGWLTAGVIAAEHSTRLPDGLRVTVIESPDVPTIGVGEGTWPTMRDTLRRMGIAETDFVRECDASFKQGSLFRGWVDGSAGDRYFHPFELPHGYTEAGLVSAWHERHGTMPFAERVSVQPHLCLEGRAPKQFATPEYAAVANYAYHLDAGRFGAFLRRHCSQRLGVVHVADHVTGIDSHDNGDIAAVQLKAAGALSGDLFIDCTGMRALLLGMHLGVPLHSQQHVLFNDSALAVQVPYARADSPIASHTISTAQDSGWVWDIGLPTRRGVGQVYSSAHTSDDAAEHALRTYVASTGGPADMPAPRKLSFQPGYRRTFWQRNCVAIGLSAGFIEPLEASAIALVELSAAWVSEQMPVNREDMDRVARRFNDAFTYRWERVIEFLKLHYVLTRRTDTAFWRDHVQPASIPGRLAEQLARWRHRPPSRYDLERIEEVFPSASYQYVLYGMGYPPPTAAAPRWSDSPDVAEGYFREAAQLTVRMLSGLPAHRALIDHIHVHGLSRI